MRFKALPPLAQLMIADFWADYVDQADADLFYPIVSSDIWLKAFRKLNVKIRSGGMPSVEDFDRVSDLVDEWVHGPAPEHGTCACCGVTY